MKSFVALAGLVSLFMALNTIHGGPLKGSRSFGHKMSGASVNQDGKTVPAKFEFKEIFQGGRRACVIVKGDHDPVVNLGIYIYDNNDRLVAEDDGRGDFVAAIWYPPRNAAYKIVIHNNGEQWNKCYIAVK